MNLPSAILRAGERLALLTQEATIACTPVAVAES